MADENVQALIAELGLNTRKIEQQQARLYKKFEQTFDSIEKRGSKRLTAVEKRAEDMSRNVRRAIAGIALGVAGREVASYADAWIDLNNKVKAAAEVSGFQGRAMADLAADARAARSEIEPYVDLYSRILRSGKGVAESEAQIAKVTQITAKAFAAGGAAATEQAAGVLQLGQALGSGFLQGDELRSLRENAPLVAKAIADAMGVSIGELKQLGAEGKLTSDIVFRALLGAEDAINSAFAVTAPRATLEAVLAFDNLKLKVGEFLAEGGQVESVSHAAAAAINFVADNLQLLTDAIVIGSAALAGFYGTQGLIAVASGLNSVAVGATTGAKAMAILRAAMAFMGGPWAIGMAAVAGAIALIMTYSSKAKKPLETMRDRLEDIDGGLRSIAANAGIPWEEIANGAAAAKTPVDEVTAKLETLRKKLLETGAAARQIAIDQATTKLIEATAARDQALSNIESIQNKREFRRAGNAKQKAEELATATAQLEAAERKLAEAESLRSAIFTGTTNADFKPGQTGGSGGGEEDKAIEAALVRIRDEYNKTFETERDTLARIYEEQLKSIDASKRGEAEKADLRAKALAVYKQGLAEVREQEFEDFNAYLDEQQAKADKEKDALNQVLDARDQMLGRTSTLLQREYELRRAKIANEIEDEATKNEALAAIDEEYAEAKKQLADKVLGRGAESEKAVDRIRAEEEEKLAELEDWYQLNLDALAEYEARKQEIIDESEAEIRDLRLESARIQLEAGEKMFNGLSGIAKAFAGKQSGIYKVLFATEKAFAIGAATIAMFQNIAEASKAGYPQNLALMAAAAAQGAAILGSIQGTAANFADGAVRIQGPGTRTSDSIPANLSKDESVISAEGTLRNENILHRINAGEDIEAQMAQLQQATAPIEFNPYLLAGGGRQISIAGSRMNFYGPVDREALPAYRQALDEKNRELVDTVESVIYRNATHTTARHERNRFLRK